MTSDSGARTPGERIFAEAIAEHEAELEAVWREGHFRMTHGFMAIIGAKIDALLAERDNARDAALHNKQLVEELWCENTRLCAALRRQKAYEYARTALQESS